MTNSYPEPKNRPDDATRTIVVAGIALGLGGLVHVYTDPEPTAVQILELLLVSVPAALIVYGGYWTASRRFSAAERWTVATWCLVGGLIGGALVSGFLFGESVTGDAVADGSLLFLIGLSTGGVVGLLGAMATRQSIPAFEDETGQFAREFELEALSPEARSLASVATSPYAWDALQAVLDADEPIGVETLAARIAALEGEPTESVRLELVHAQLPELADRGLVSWDAERGTVDATARLPAVVGAGEELSALRDRTDGR
ncbi:hypothetical protein [Natronococcus sp.]|uniref:DUF7344 domain-containing protein n=1 Tax=Natronococcus sp. TaxID=35747 RepID=UPI003A4E348A